jgi:ATP-dependent Lhr-like helicase
VAARALDGAGGDGESLGQRIAIPNVPATRAEVAGALVDGPSAVEVEDALWGLVAGGRVTGEGFAGLGYLLTPATKRAAGPRRRRARRFARATPLLAAGRWSLLRAPAPLPDAAGGAEADPALEALAKQYVRRWGVVFRDVVAREPRAPPRGEVVRLSACDPLNLVGILTPGPRVPGTLGNAVAYRDDVPIDANEARTGRAPSCAARRWATRRRAGTRRRRTTPMRRTATVRAPGGIRPHAAHDERANRAHGDAGGG